MGYKTVYTIIISFLKASEANEHNPEKHESRFNVLFLLLVVIMRFQGVENFNNNLYRHMAFIIVCGVNNQNL